MILPHSFTQAPKNDFAELAPAAGRLRALEQAFAENSLPEDYTPARLAAYAKSLLALQREDGSFSVSRKPEELEPDELTDALLFVTWTAAAFLRLTETRLPEEAAKLPGLHSALLRALNSPGACRLDFPESGPAAPVQQIEAVLILSSGGIPAMLREDAAAAPALRDALSLLKEQFQRRLETGETSLVENVDYRELYLQAFNALSDTPS